MFEEKDLTLDTMHLMPVGKLPYPILFHPRTLYSARAENFALFSLSKGNPLGKRESGIAEIYWTRNKDNQC